MATKHTLNMEGEDGSKRTVPMQVLSLGMSRTGTKGMQQALEELGFKHTYHGFESHRRKDGFLWAELVDRKYGNDRRPITRVDFDRILGDCAAVSDLPCIAFWSELMDAYPEAKVVLVERDVESWFCSFKAVIIDHVFNWKSDVIVAAVKVGLFPKLPNMYMRTLWLRFCRAQTAREMEENGREIYKDHYAGIIARAEAEGRPLLRTKLSDGLHPLCEFLSAPIPHHDEFPRINDMAEIVQVIQGYQNHVLGLILWRLGKIAGVATLALTTVIWFMRRRS